MPKIDVNQCPISLSIFSECSSVWADSSTGQAMNRPRRCSKGTWASTEPNLWAVFVGWFTAVDFPGGPVPLQQRAGWEAVGPASHHGRKGLQVGRNAERSPSHRWTFPLLCCGCHQASESPTRTWSCASVRLRVSVDKTALLSTQVIGNAPSPRKGNARGGGGLDIAS